VGVAKGGMRGHGKGSICGRGKRLYVWAWQKVVLAGVAKGCKQ